MPPAKNKLSFEAQIKRLQDIVTELEKGNVPLEKSVALYKEGIELSRNCHEQLKTAKHEISILSEGLIMPFKENEDDDEFGDDEDQA